MWMCVVAYKLMMMLMMMIMRMIMMMIIMINVNLQIGWPGRVLRTHPCSAGMP